MDNQTPQLITDDQFNERVRGWSVSVRSRMAGRAPRSGGEDSKFRESKKLSDSIISSVKLYYGAANRVSFKFERHGIYVQYGAGRGHGGAKGSTWYNRHGMLVRTASSSLGRMNSGGRRAVDWFELEVRWGINELANIVQEYYGDVAMKRLLYDFDRFLITKR